MAAAASKQPPPRRLATRDAVTEQQLKNQVAATAGMDAQMASKTKPQPLVRASMKSSLLENSIILFDGHFFTFVPVGSILNLPPSHRQKVVAQPQGDFTFWPTFLERNASWLAAKEVPLKMAKGDTKAAEAVLQGMHKDPRVIVSVYKGGPISILEPTPEAKAEAAKKAAASEAAGAEAAAGNSQRKS